MGPSPLPFMSGQRVIFDAILCRLDRPMLSPMLSHTLPSCLASCLVPCLVPRRRPAEPSRVAQSSRLLRPLHSGHSIILGSIGINDPTPVGRPGAPAMTRRWSGFGPVGLCLFCWFQSLSHVPLPRPLGSVLSHWVSSQFRLVLT